MYRSESLPQPIKIVLYTHPFCRTSWNMQKHWRRFADTFASYMTYQFCISKETPASATEEEPVTSPHAACLAVKAAGLQSPLAADLYLERLREAAFVEDRDVSKMNVLVELARDVNKAHRGFFDFQRFGSDFDAKPARLALQADLQRIYCNRIEKFPTITMTTAGTGLKMTGLSTYQQLAQNIHRLMDMSQRVKAAVAK
ncbi:DsbA family protein [Dyadobacter luticola]|uniref:DsbA family protein n=1 Tax=Dyadobacter luticola TaxID=1979387 RepID=A0A5R9L4A2_9BACT|nr:DsbA family protein [Dyadobacter luticola]TLV03412.1 hypothetical protein FEN17_07345 [Dyadobacter luticola]